MTVFVSYARADHQTIQPVLSALREHGFELWIDEEGIEGASFWRKEIVAAIENSSVILFFATEASCISDAVFRELTLANEENKPILPVFLKTIKLPSDLRYQIAGIQNINLEHNLENGIRNIIVSLCRITATNSNKNIKVDSKALNVKKYVFQNKKFKRIFFFFILVVSSVLGYLFIQNSEKPAVQNQISNADIKKVEQVYCKWLPVTNKYPENCIKMGGLYHFYIKFKENIDSSNIIKGLIGTELHFYQNGNELTGGGLPYRAIDEDYVRERYTKIENTYMEGICISTDRQTKNFLTIKLTKADNIIFEKDVICPSE